MKINRLFPNHFLLAIGWHQSAFSLVLFKNGRIERFEKILLRETSDESITAKAASILNGLKPAEIVLVLPRAEVLQKELVVPRNDSTREALQNKVEELLPYSSKEMSYGFFLNEEQDSSRGLLLALPEKKVDEILSFLKRIGLSPDDVITEDQPLLWLAAEDKAIDHCLIVDEDSERILCLLAKEGSIRYSRVFPPASEPSYSSSDFLEELSFFFLETGEKPRSLMISRSLSPDLELSMMRHFSLPVERLSGKMTENISAALLGAACYGKYPAVSLLPHSVKIQRLASRQKKLFNEIVRSSVFLFAAFLLLFSALALQKKIEIRKISNEVKALSVQAGPLQKIRSSLNQFAESQASKQKLLLFLKELNLGIPAGIKLQGLRIEGEEVVLRAESPSHAVISEAVQALEKTGGLEKAVLEHSRLRRRLNQDIFEFEVKARWKS